MCVLCGYLALTSGMSADFAMAPSRAHFPACTRLCYAPYGGFVTLVSTLDAFSWSVSRSRTVVRLSRLARYLRGMRPRAAYLASSVLIAESRNDSTRPLARIPVRLVLRRSIGEEDETGSLVRWAPFIPGIGAKAVSRSVASVDRGPDPAGPSRAPFERRWSGPTDTKIEPGCLTSTPNLVDAPQSRILEPKICHH